MSNQAESNWDQQDIDNCIIQYQRLNPNRFEFRFSLDFPDENYCGVIVCENEKREKQRVGRFTRQLEGGNYLVRATLDVPGVHYIDLMFWGEDEDPLTSHPVRQEQNFMVEIDADGKVSIEPQL